MNSIALDDVTKTFDSGYTALDGVSLDFSRGELHVILGENGAGKSTLMHVLSGLIEPTSGSIKADGHAVAFASTADALALGISMVHQRPLLSDSLSIAENVVIGSGHPFVNRDEIRARMQCLASHWDMDESRFRATATLSPQDRFRVALLGALWNEPSFLVLDEPTAVFSGVERERFMECLVRATREGLAAIMITHSVGEALRWSDRVSVLRRGALAYSEKVTQATEREIQPFFTPQPPSTPLTDLANSTNSNEVRDAHVAQVCAASDLTTRDRTAHTCAAHTRAQISFSAHALSASFTNRPYLTDITFRADPGEITGIFGLPGNGIDVLEDLLTGMLPAATGSVTFEPACDSRATRVELVSPSITARALRAAGAGLVPSNRAFRGSNPDVSLREVLACYRTLSVHDADAFAESLLRSEGIDAKPSRLAATLSGGQLQRLILARELAENPALLILAEPEWGLDIASVSRFRERMMNAAKDGTTIIILTDSPETMKENGFFSRIYRLDNGALA